MVLTPHSKHSNTSNIPNTLGKEVQNWIAMHVHFLVLTEKTSGNIGYLWLQAPWMGFKFLQFMQSERLLIYICSKNFISKVYKIHNTCLICIIFTCVAEKNLNQLIQKLDGVGPIDNRSSTDKLHHFVQKKKKKKKKIINYET